MGEKSRKLHSYVAFCLYMYYLQSSRTFRIGSKPGHNVVTYHVDWRQSWVVRRANTPVTAPATSSNPVRFDHGPVSPCRVIFAWIRPGRLEHSSSAVRPYLS